MKKLAEIGIDLFPGRHSKKLAGKIDSVFLIVFLLLSAIMLVAPSAARADVSVGVSVTIGPPPIPVYTQPLCPGPGFIWIPGYWAWDPDFAYYWVPGMWSPAPFVGALWTPGYWAWSSGVYIWYDGYWGTRVGFYGGINYGFGYTGHGYYGGYWSGNRYYYNRTVNNIDVRNITTVYNRNVERVRPAGPSFHGGRGGTVARPTSEQLAAARERRTPITAEQRQHMQVARDNPEQRATVNRGRPAIVATPRPGVFTGRGVVRSGRAEAPGTLPRVRQTPRPGSVQPPVGARERMTPGTPQRRSEPRYNEPGPRYSQPGRGQPQQKPARQPQQRERRSDERKESR